ncbi:glutamine--fructose-6-phosphate transaminase (isomerizing) [Haloplanus sp. C73]|uniref:glutamine--fructose-6-phosphate transaminase (isomerizing) n=1 Tax=Haloplanus sp. C73 TaxID=3421641 RepID=UPI003EBA4CDA
MCGIIGCIGTDRTTETLLSGLSNLEYRGYDSTGIALGGPSLAVEKREGELTNLRDHLADTDLPGSALGIGHTRWSTHGAPSDANAHPHTDERGRVAVVHNGIIENADALRDELRADGVTFTSDTDSEVVPHLVAAALADGHAPRDAVRTAVDRLEGSYALTIVVGGVEALFAVRNDMPVVLGIGDDAHYVASDIPAFLDRTRDVVFLDDGELAVLRPDDWEVTDGGDPVSKTVRTADWEPEQTGRSGYDHFMLKEINEQPRALRQCLRGRTDDLADTVEVDALAGLDRPERVHFVACGTSYHASLYGAQLLRDMGIPARADLASEYALAPPPMDAETLVVGVTQSGETADTLNALRAAESKGAATLAVTNVVGSTAARECDTLLPIRAGPEIAVAASKTFSSQLVALNLLAEHLRSQERRWGGASKLRALPQQVQQVLDDSAARDVVDAYHDRDAFFFVGRGYNRPVALEGALKFKEITYKHAEGFAAGELKHGPLALVSERTPVVAVVTGSGPSAQKTVNTIKEVKSRGAPIVAVTDGRTDVARYADAVLDVPAAEPRIAAVLANVQLQLVAYYTALGLDRSIDKPRNLAKSVTVE